MTESPNPESGPVETLEQDSKGSDAFRIVANLTHELKTPLHSILSVASLLASELDGPLGAEQKKQVEIIQRNGDHLLDLINGLLAFSTSNTKTRTLTLERVSPISILSALKEELSPLARRQSIDLNLTHARVPDYFYTDVTLFKRITGNLLGNALKFTREGGEVNINLDTDTTNGALVLEIMDTGIGMTPATKESLFKAFYQEDGSTTREYGGVGLGLSLVKNAIEQLGGTISVQSEPGQGSIFKVIFPDQLANVKIPRILIVDEDEGSRESIRILLTREGYDVWAGGFNELRAECLDGRASAIVLDVSPSSDEGFSVLKELKEFLSHTGVPVIGLSTSIDPKGRLKAYNEGINDLIAKPFEADELLIRIKVQLERGRKSE